MSWVHYSDRKPTEGESLHGFVLAVDACERIYKVDWQYGGRDAVAWMNPNDLLPLPKRKIRRPPTQADIDKATEPIPCWVCTYNESLWHKRILLGVSKFGPRRYVASSGPDTCITAWEKCEIEVEE